MAGLMVVPAIRAGSGKPPPHPIEQPAPAQAGLPQGTQRLTRHQAEVRRLEQDVARQESESRRASERLRQQDQAIADLHKQLQSLHAKPPLGHP
ncbi:MAG TPA: hypothetical protein VIM06_04005 [Rhodanobacter sp.]